MSDREPQVFPWDYARRIMRGLIHHHEQTARDTESDPAVSAYWQGAAEGVRETERMLEDIHAHIDEWGED